MGTTWCRLNDGTRLTLSRTYRDRLQEPARPGDLSAAADARRAGAGGVDFRRPVFRRPVVPVPALPGQGAALDRRHAPEPGELLDLGRIHAVHRPPGRALPVQARGGHAALGCILRFALALLAARCFARAATRPVDRTAPPPSPSIFTEYFGQSFINVFSYFAWWRWPTRFSTMRCTSSGRWRHRASRPSSSAPRSARWRCSCARISSSTHCTPSRPWCGRSELRRGPDDRRAQRPAAGLAAYRWSGGDSAAGGAGAGRALSRDRADPVSGAAGDPGLRRLPTRSMRWCRRSSSSRWWRTRSAMASSGARHRAGSKSRRVGEATGPWSSGCEDSLPGRAHPRRGRRRHRTAATPRLGSATSMASGSASSLDGVPAAGRSHWSSFPITIGQWTMGPARTGR